MSNGQVETLLNSGFPFEGLPPEHLDPDYLSEFLLRVEEPVPKEIADLTGYPTRTVAYLGEFPDEKSREIVERALIQLAMTGGSRIMEVAKLLGVESNPQAIEDLEIKYDVSLEELKIGAIIGSLTYEHWALTSADPRTEQGREHIEKRLQGILDQARRLSTKQLRATHQVHDPKAANSIRDSGIIRASDSGNYEGKGPYVGLIGGFGDWGLKEGTFVFNVSLGDTLPIATGRGEMETMAVVLCDELDISTDPATPRGTIEWFNGEYCIYSNDGGVVDWQLQQLEKFFGPQSAFVVKGDHGESLVVIDTEDPPIVWANAARALKIEHIMTLKSFLEFYN